MRSPVMTDPALVRAALWHNASMAELEHRLAHERFFAGRERLRKANTQSREDEDKQGHGDHDPDNPAERLGN